MQKLQADFILFKNKIEFKDVIFLNEMSQQNVVSCTSFPYFARDFTI